MSFIRRLLPYAPYALLALMVLGPLLAPGYVLSMDMVFTPVLRLADHVDNTWLLYAALHGLDVILPADVVQKMVLGSALFLSGAGMHRLLLRLRPDGQPNWRWAVYTGGVLYMVNPFVYDRLMAGQWGVWLGYALLPWFAACLLGFVRSPDRRGVLAVTAWTIAVSIVSIHSLGLVAILVIVALLAKGRDRLWLRRAVKWGGLSAGLFVLLSSYWLVPALLGQGRIAGSLQTFNADGRAAFMTVDAVGTGQVGAVLGLMGFWQETRDLYVLPIESYEWWWLAHLILLSLVVAGAVSAWHRQRSVARLAIVLSIVAILLAVGLGGDWLARYAPFFAGYREPQKFTALLALSYGYFVAWGAAWLLDRAQKHRLPHAVSSVLLMLLPLAYAPTMLWGAAGQLRTTDYPSDWTTVNDLLRAQSDNYKVLVLPWHLYMSYTFSARIIASPAKAFYDRQVVISDDPELPGVAPQTRDVVRDKLQREVLPAAAAGEQIVLRLRELGVGYVILNKALDWQDYAYLDQQAGARLIYEGQTIRLYRLAK